MSDEVSKLLGFHISIIPKTSEWSGFFVCQLLVLSVFRYFLPIFMSSFEILVRCLAHICITCFLDFSEGCLYIFGYPVSDVQLAEFLSHSVGSFFINFFCCCLGFFLNVCRTFYEDPLINYWS